MRRAIVVVGVVLTMALAAATTASAEKPLGPSCNGVFSSSAAGDPGHVADAAHTVKDLAGLFGVTPGFITSLGAHAHGENLADCGG